ncbi:MAG: DNA gyrase inhibitor YacG [Xanthobacteraceae bacterium]|nr:MAG: DNA gyrase inhibitor YacG [Xanthobacteraceae bacterium]
MADKADKAKCPICGKPTVAEWRPFCSDRCRKVDLNRWLTGVYTIPGDDGDADSDSDGPAGPPDKDG